jgi:hypothetical protein
MADDLGSIHRVPPNVAVSDQDRQRRAEQLRENLKKRKDQQRRRDARAPIADEVVIDGHAEPAADDAPPPPRHLADFEA